MYQNLMYVAQRTGGRRVCAHARVGGLCAQFRSHTGYGAKSEALSAVRVTRTTWALDKPVFARIQRVAAEAPI